MVHQPKASTRFCSISYLVSTDLVWHPGLGSDRPAASLSTSPPLPMMKHWQWHSETQTLLVKPQIKQSHKYNSALYVLQIHRTEPESSSKWLSTSVILHLHCGYVTIILLIWYLFHVKLQSSFSLMTNIHPRHIKTMGWKWKPSSRNLNPLKTKQPTFLKPITEPWRLQRRLEMALSSSSQAVPPLQEWIWKGKHLI